MDTHSSDVRALVARVEAMEQASIRLKRVFAVGAVLAVAASGMALTMVQTEVIEAEAFRLVDGNGQLHASLSLTDGAAGLTFYAPSLAPMYSSTQPVLKLGAFIDVGPGVAIYEPDGQVRVSLLRSVMGGAGLEVYEPDGQGPGLRQTRVILGVGPGGEANLRFLGEEGVLWRAPR